MWEAWVAAEIDDLLAMWAWWSIVWGAATKGRQMGKTVFVVGAGASNEIGLPLGNDFKNDVAQALAFDFDIFEHPIKGDIQIYSAIKEYIKQSEDSPGMDAYLQACMQIITSTPGATSIDSLIDQHKNNNQIRLCGKLSIVRLILKAENSSPLYLDPDIPGDTLDLERFENTWYLPFLRFLGQGIQFDGLADRLNDITLVVFNYDRCIEQFLHEAIKVQYGVDSETVANALSSLQIIHPYGEVGRFIRQNAKMSVRFGSDKVESRLLEISNEIRTYTEQLTDHEVVDEIRNTISQADKIVFLGFAFHQQNLDLICPEVPGQARRVIATAVKMSESNRKSIEYWIASNICGSSTDIVSLREDLECRHLFGEYERDLALT